MLTRPFFLLVEQEDNPSTPHPISPFSSSYGRRRQPNTTSPHHYQVAKFSQKQERRTQQKADLREKLAGADKEKLLASLVPKVLTKQEKALRQKEARKKQQKGKPCKVGHKGGKNKPSKKFKASAFLKPSKKSKPSIKGKPSHLLKEKAHGHRQHVLRDLERAVQRLSALAGEHGIIKRGRKSKSEESLESPSKEAKPEAITKEEENTKGKEEELSPVEKMMQEATEQLLLLTALQSQLAKDLDRTEEREVALLEARLAQEAAKVKNSTEGKEFKRDLAELESLLELARKLQPPLPPPTDAPPVADGEPWKRKREEQEAGPEKKAKEGSAPAESQAAEPSAAAESQAAEPSAAGASLHLNDAEALLKLEARLGGLKTDEVSSSKYLVVAHEDATKSVKGTKGTLYQIKAGVAEFFPMGSAVRKVSCPEAWIVYISELEAKTSAVNTKKICTWIDGDLAGQIYSAFTFKDSDEVPDDPAYYLWADQVDAGITEILYRILPGRGFVVLPSSLAQFLTCFTVESHKEVTSGDKPKPGEVQIGDLAVEIADETAKYRQQLFEKAEKAKTLAIPIKAGEHWTLLVLTRKNKEGASSSTSATNPLGAFDRARRQTAEKDQIDSVPWPIFPKDVEEEWETRYIDTLKTPSSKCAKVARDIIDLLRGADFGVFKEPVLPVKNSKKQTGATCGLWILHYIEEEARHHVGEHRGTLEPCLEYRRERLNSMQKALLLRITQKETQALKA